MAKLPQKVAIDDATLGTTAKTFVSTAMVRPSAGGKVTRVNISLTDEDIDDCESLEESLSLSRVEVFRAGLIVLRGLPAESQRTAADQARRRSPKAGRPSVKK